MQAVIYESPRKMVVDEVALHLNQTERRGR